MTGNSILFGNGINRLNDNNISWNRLLNTIKGRNVFNNGGLPNTMIYERVILEQPDLRGDIIKDEYETKTKISNLLEGIEPHYLYQELFKLNANNYLTTNYDYGFINSVKDIDENHLIKDHSTENIYSVRRKKIISSNGYEPKNVWHIHGEISLSPSIMLGLDHYSGSIGKINNYIKGNYEYTLNGSNVRELSIGDKFEKESFSGTSWLELFFTSNVHIVGFTLDYSEFDLWWVLNKRARMMRGSRLRQTINNRIRFYCIEIEEEKEGLLKSLNVEVIRIPTLKGKDKYFSFYENFLKNYNTHNNT